MILLLSSMTFRGEVCHFSLRLRSTCEFRMLNITRNILKSDAPPNATQFACPKDYAHAIDPERTPDYRLWLEATLTEYVLLDTTMGC